MNHCQTKTTNKIIMKIKHLLIGLFAVAATVACTQEQPAETPKLEVDKEAVSLAATAAESSFNVTSNQAWAATADADWVTLDPASGEAATEAVAVKVTAEDNTAKEARTAKVTVKAGELTKTVTVTQAAAGEEPEPEKPVVEEKTYILVGDAVGGWNVDENGVVLTLDGTTDGYYVAKAVEVTGQKGMHFTKNSSWEGNVKGKHGLIAPNEIGEVGGNDISLTESGTYDVYLTEALDKFYFMSDGKLPSEAVEHVEIAVVWGVCGAYGNNNWGNGDPDVVLAQEGEWYVAKNIEFTEVSFKVRGNNSWADDLKWGREAEDTKCALNVAIPVSTCTDYKEANTGATDNPGIYIGGAGTYDVYFSPDKKEVWVMTPGYKPGDDVPEPDPVDVTYTLTGTVEGHYWDNNAAAGLMTLEGDYYVVKNISLLLDSTMQPDGTNPADYVKFKICETGTWNAYGVAAENADVKYAPNTEIPVVSGGSDIFVDGAGKYDVYFDKTNGKLWVMAAGYKPGDEVPVPGPSYNIISSTEVTEWGVDAFAALFTQYGSAEVTEDFICEDLYFFAGGGKFKFGENKNAAGEKVARFQFGGSGNYEKNKQIVKFFVPGPGTLKVEAISSGDTERPLMVAIDGTPTVETGYSLPVKAETPIVVEVDCSTATSGSEIALWSGDSGINVFSVKWIPAGVTETEPTPEPEPVTTETTIWEGTHNTGNWSGLEELSWGRYDWSTVAAGQRLKVYVTPNDPSSDWWCLSLRSAGTNWPTLVGAKDQYDKATYSVTIPLTQETIDDLLANNGLVLTGSETTINKVTILPADAENVIWAGEMESNGYSNCTIGTVNDLANNGAAVGDKFRIYVEGGEGWSFMITDGQWNKWFATASDGSQEGLYGKGFDSYNTDLSKGYIEFEITEAMAAAYAGYGWGNLVILQGNAVKFTKISLL